MGNRVRVILYLDREDTTRVQLRELYFGRGNFCVTSDFRDFRGSSGDSVGGFGPAGRFSKTSHDLATSGRLVRDVE